MPFSCAFDAGFSNAFEICPPTDTGEPDTRYLRGIPSAIPRIRKRPDVAEISGQGWIGVIGAGGLSGDACLEGDLEQAVDLFGHLVRETFTYLIGQIRSGAECVLAGEYGLDATAVVAFTGYGAVRGELLVSGGGAVAMALEGQPTLDTTTQGLMQIRVGAEAAITGQESDEAVILAAAMMLQKLLTNRSI